MTVFGVVRLLTRLEPPQLKMGSVTDAFHIAFQQKQKLNHLLCHCQQS